MIQLYVRRSDTAAEFYKEAFGLDGVADFGRHDDGTYIHSQFNIGGQILFLSELTDCEPVAGNTIQICIEFGKNGEEAVRKAYDVLCDGAKIEHSLGPCEWNPLLFSLVDKFGVNWCVYL
ncbi:MAG: VOC family protein [Oscillospiraceae bacterium]|nr:VOC family protein [Oscillospiraceae bacterium]